MCYICIYIIDTYIYTNIIYYIIYISLQVRLLEKVDFEGVCCCVEGEVGSLFGLGGK